MAAGVMRGQKIHASSQHLRDQWKTVGPGNLSDGLHPCRSLSLDRLLGNE